MDLWNEYEGRSIDGLFPLERLIRPEGRSAFFSTSSAGTSTVIRLIESHFDEDEILARWTGVSDLRQPNLLTLTRFGQAMMDETSLVYVVMEPTEADLSQILCDRPLTLAETRQVAASLIPALQALHAKGFLHEHIQPANVLAVGEVVKLRSDCIREAPEGAEGLDLQRRDVQDLAALLLQCVTQQRNQAISPNSPPLPAPFREIIHNGLSGTWGLTEMGAALEATAPQPVKIQEALRPAVAPAPAMMRELQRDPGPPQTTLPAPTLIRLQTKDATQRSAAAAPHTFPEPASGRIRVPLREQSGSPQRWLSGLAIAVVCLMLFAVYTVIHRHGAKNASIQTAAQPVSKISPVTNAAAPTAPATPNPVTQPLKAASRAEWRVVAFTYNKQDQAAAKARTLEESFKPLRPAVFSPTGRAPFLVTLGGPLSREAAFSLRSKLRNAGLPRDLYAQNYSKSR